MQARSPGAFEAGASSLGRVVRGVVADGLEASVPLGALWVALAALVMAVGFAVVGHHGGGPVQPVDNRLAKALFADREVPVVDAAKVLAQLGSVAGLAIVTLCLSAWLRSRGRRASAAVPLVAFLGAEALVWVGKVAIARPRPALSLQAGHETDWSFPSGHSTAAAAVVVSLAMLWFQRRRAHRWLVLGAALVAAGVMAASRLELDVHWLSDVVTGVLIGVVWGVITSRHLTDRRVVQPRSVPPPDPAGPPR
jgi:undecaprenyl-diphosphatase